MASITTLFPTFPVQMPLMERINITILRQQHNYFKDWSNYELEEQHIPNIARPLSPPLITAIYQTHLKKNEVARNRRLAFCITANKTDNAPT